MNKEVSITYTEQSKAVVVTTKVDYSGDNIPSNEDIIKEAQDVFTTAHRFAVLETMKKNKK